MPRSEASTRLLLAALGLSPDELDDALVWARGRAGELLDSLDDTELRAVLEREPVASSRRARLPTPAPSAPQAPAPTIASWNLPRAPWQPSRSKKPSAPTSAPQDEPTGVEDEVPTEEADGTRDEEKVLADESAAVGADGTQAEPAVLEAEDADGMQAEPAEDADGTQAESAVLEAEAPAEEVDETRDEETVLADESAAEDADGPWDGDTLLADGDSELADESAAEDADGPWDEDTLLSDDDVLLADDDVLLADDDVMLADESPKEARGPWHGEAILADGPPPPPQEPPVARPRASPRVVPAAAARPEDRDPDAPTIRTDHSRRRATRYSLSTPVVVRVDQVSGLHEMSTRDISRHGIFIESTSPPEPNARISVQLPFPDGSGVVSLVGEVVRVVTTRQAAASGKAPGFGVTFSPVSEEHRQELERLLEHAKASAAADVPRPRSDRATRGGTGHGDGVSRVESAQEARAPRVESVQRGAPRVERVQPARGAASKISKD